MRAIDADAYSAEMKDRQEASWKWRNEAIAEEDEVKLARAEGAYTAFTEAKLTMDKHIINPWHRVEDGLPDDEVPVLAMLHNTYGRNVVLKLCHIGHHKRTTEEYGWQEYEGETEYDEENDCFWIPEGWWESNYHEDNLNWQIGETDGTITHWMPLPEPPKEDANADK